MNPLSFPAIPELEADEKQHRRRIAAKINTLNQGKFNATIDITLTASATSTTLTDPRIYATSFIGFMPQTSSGATALAAGIYVTSMAKGSCTLNHASNAAADQKLRVLIVG